MLKCKRQCPTAKYSDLLIVAEVPKNLSHASLVKFSWDLIPFELWHIQALFTYILEKVISAIYFLFHWEQVLLIIIVIIELFHVNWYFLPNRYTHFTLCPEHVKAYLNSFEFALQNLDWNAPSLIERNSSAKPSPKCCWFSQYLPWQLDRSCTQRRIPGDLCIYIHIWYLLWLLDSAKVLANFFFSFFRRGFCAMRCEVLKYWRINQALGKHCVLVIIYWVRLI